LICARGHSYDIARSGYVNLLQPQARKSPAAGDSRAAVEARARLVAGGVGRPAIEAVVARAAALLPDVGRPVVVELGSGSGETLGLLAARREICGVGIDLSTAATTHAARRYPAVTWVVANADRRLPLLDGSVDLVLSVHARRNPEECRRVLTPGGFLLVSIPAADDLIELREATQGDRVERDRMTLLLADHGALFSVTEHFTTRTRHDLDQKALLDLLHGTYRGQRLGESARAQRLDRLTVTLASDILLFTPRVS
jgi:23S rRNA (guanine745-N1)-methyltransferase